MIDERLLSDSRLRRFLDVIAYAEGVKQGYYTLFGNGRFDSLAHHPNIRVPFFNRATGKQDYSTAAGRYQINYPTYLEFARKVNKTDFSEYTQDLIAAQILHETGALARLLNNDFAGAVSAARRRWASFPSAGYGQGERTLTDLQRVYTSAVGQAGNAVTTASDNEESTATTVGVIIAIGLLLGKLWRG
jgi:muramidase (phage lysozyme)